MHASMKHSSMLPALAFVFLIPASSFCETQTKSVLFGFEASQLPEGSVDPKAVAEASRSGENLSQKPFELRFSQNSEASASTVSLADGVKALRMRPGAAAENPSPAVALGYIDADLSSHIDDSIPLHLEVKFQRSNGPLSVNFSMSFLRDGAFTLANLGGISGFIQPEGTYVSNRTFGTTSKDELRGPDLPAEQTVTVRCEIKGTPEGLTMKTSVLVAGESIFDTSESPSILAGFTLQELQRMSMVVSTAPKGLGEEFFDLISLKVWQ
jgi:hypothetical protein